MTAFSFCFPIADRWDLPRGASLKFSRLQPGGLMQGPEENSSLFGRTFGFVIALLLLGQGWNFALSRYSGAEHYEGL
jgi:hypothetical protein